MQLSASKGDGSSAEASRASLASACALLAASLAALFALAWLRGFRLTGVLPGLSDLTSYFLPKYEFAAARAREGALPLWNPYELFGMPFLATMQPGVLYPPLRLVYLVLDGSAAYVALLALHLALGAFLSLRLARSLGLAPWPSVLASSWVALPALLLRVNEHPVYFEAVAWIPGLVLASRRVVLAPTARAVALLGLASALLALSGYPPFVLATAYSLLLAVPFWMLEIERPGRLAAVARAGGALVASAGVAATLAAAQLLPAAAWLPESERAEVVASWTPLQEAWPSNSLPYLIGLPEPTLAASLRDVWLEFGPALLALAASAPWRRGLAPVVAFCVTLFGVATLLPFDVLRRLPFYDQVRFGLEWTFIAPIPVFLLAAIGLDAALRRIRSRAGAAACAVGAMVCTVAWNQSRIADVPVAPRPQRLTELPAGVDEACDLRPGRFRFYWPSIPAHGVPLASRRASIGGVEQSVPPLRSAQLARVLGIDSYLARDWVRGFRAHRRLLQRVGLRCVISEGPVPQLAAAGFELVPREDATVYLYRRGDALPRTRIVFRAFPARSPEEALALVTGEKVDPRRVVVLEGPPPPARRPCLAPRATVENLRSEEEAIHVRVETSCPGYLVVSDTHAPGWTARVDGAPAPIHRADYAFRAVAVDRGSHEISLEYRPASVRWGIGLSLLGLLALVVLLRLPAARDPFRRR